MDSSQIANYIFIIGGLLIVSALGLYTFFPKLRKNSFSMQGLDKLPELTSIDKRYDSEISSGNAFIVKGRYGDFYSKKNMVIMILLIFPFVFFLSYLDLQAYKIIHSCAFNEKLSLNLFFNELFLIDSMFLTLLCFFFITKKIITIIYGSKTGLTHNPNKSYLVDTLIRKYQKSDFKKDILSIFLILAFMVFNLVSQLNWNIINKSSSLAEANKIAYKQCMIKKRK